MQNLKSQKTGFLLDMVKDTAHLAENMENLKQEFQNITFISEFLPTKKVAKQFESERKTVLDGLKQSIKHLEDFCRKYEKMARGLID